MPVSGAPRGSEVSPHSAKGALSSLLSVNEASGLDVATVARLFSAHVNPGQLHFMRLLGFDRVLIDRAEGVYYYTRDGRRILDLFGGFGTLALGHNHPRLLEVRHRFQEERRHDISMAFLSQYATALAHNLATIAPGDLDMVFLGSTGSEAVEAAIKLAERVQGPSRSRILYAENSFHGKTKGALSITDSYDYRSGFALPDNSLRVPFGDISVIEAALEADSALGIIVLETIQGGAGIVEAPAGFWRDLRSVCSRRSVLWIADEVQCGMGRSGSFFAFEFENVVPDIVTLAKALGGGKTAMAAMIARRPIYMQGYGSPATAMIHGPSTFSGMGEACCTAIETLHILYEEGLIENAAFQGEYLITQLNDLAIKHPHIIKEVRGRGLMVGLEFRDLSEIMPPGLRQAVSMFDNKLKGSVSALVGALLLHHHDVLVAFTQYNRNVIRLEPPLVIQHHHIDYFIKSLDHVLSRGLPRMLSDFIKLQAVPETAR